MKTRSLLGILAFALVLGLAAFLLRPRNAPLSKSVTPLQNTAPVTPPSAPNTIPNTVETLSETLTLTGLVQSGAQATLSTRLPARIAAVNIRQGDPVRQGATLIELDTADAQAQVRTAQGAVDAALAQYRKAQSGRVAQRIKAESDVAAARSGLQQAQTKRDQADLARNAARDDAASEKKLAREGVKKAEIALTRAQKTLRDLEALATVGGVSRNDLDGARTQVQIAQSDLVTAKTQESRLDAPDSQEGNGGGYRVAAAIKDVQAAALGVAQAKEGLNAAIKAQQQTLLLADQDVAAARGALEQAQAGLAAARSALAATRLVSPLAGVAASVLARVGETAQPGLPLITVVSLTGLRVEALVTARQLARLKPGQKSQISVETQPGKTFPAAVSDIARVAESDGRTFRVAFRFQNAVALRPNQKARITLTTR